jgi:DNA polymerase-3 subunit delta
VKATQKDFSAIAPRAARAARVFLFCGPDEAAASEAAREIASLLENPGERVELSGAELRRDPVRLGDEARSNSLFGDSRHILVRAAGDEAYDAVQTLLGGEAEPCPVLIVATGTTDKGRTAKLLADRPDALVAMFYPPDLRAIAKSVRDRAGAAGIKEMGDDLAERIARAAGMDIRLAQAELTKLALYLDASPERPRKVTPADFDAIGASTGDDGFGPLVDAVLGGQTARLAGELRRMRELELNPVGVLLAFERRAAQLAQLGAKLGPRGDVQGLLEAEKASRRVFWKDVPELTRQLECWRGPRLGRLVDRLMKLHQQLLANSPDSELLLARGLAEVAQVAAISRNR